MQRRWPTLCLRLLPLGLLSCGGLHEASFVDEEWLMPVTGNAPILDIPCAQATAEPGTFHLQVDDQSGYTVILERDASRVWLREPFGLVPDTCWWVPDGPVATDAYPEAPCFGTSAQYGNCDGSEPMPAPWFFHTPGVLKSPDNPSQLLTIDGVAFVPSTDGLARLDLSPTAYEPIDDGETNRTFLRWLDPLVPVDHTANTLLR